MLLSECIFVRAKKSKNMIEDFIKSEIEYFSPMIDRQKKASNEMREKWRKETVYQRIERVSLETYDIFNGIVQYGPFKGMKLNRNTWWGRSDLGSQCLGLYEKEILNHLEKVKPYNTFIDIGAADGYYAIGMLHAGLAKKSICYEISKDGQAAINENWTTNKNIGALEIYGEANETSLNYLSSDDLKDSLVLIDIEGFEFNLLQKDVIPLFKNSELIIEIHNWVDNFADKYTELLLNLSKLFHVGKINHIDRKTSHIDELRSYTDDNRLLLTSERRPCLMRFLHLKPKTID